MGAKTYDCKRHSISFCGIDIAEGFPAGSVIKINLGEAWTTVRGIGGNVVRCKTNDKSGTVTLTLLGSAEVNATLSALYTLDQNTPGGAGVGPFFVRDLNGTSVFVAPSAWISKHPDFEVAQEVTDREWIISFADMTPFTGGM